MPKLSNKKITIGQLSKLSVDERTKILEPIVKANSEQFAKIANSMFGVSDFVKSISSIGSIASSVKFPIVDIINNFKLPELPQLNDFYRPLDIPEMKFERYDPPVTIRKSKEELQKEAREAYMVELQIKVLEQQLNLYNGMLAPQYDINAGIINFLGKKIEIPLNTKLEMVCRVVLKNVSTMKKRWSWDEIVEENRENPNKFKLRQIYKAVRAINDKVAVETQIRDFFISKPYSTVLLNPKFLAK